jgi:hypothetical protein
MRTLLCLAALALVAAPPASARTVRPLLDAQLGATTGIAGGVNEGGLTLSLAGLWPVTSGVRSGVELGADDFGAAMDRLRDPHDHTDLGAVASIHRQALSARWRLDGELPAWRRWTPVLSTAWGIYRVRDDHVGHVTNRVTTAGLSVGAGVHHPLGQALQFGFTGRWHRLLDQTTGRWLSVGLDLAW